MKATSYTHFVSLIVLSTLLTNISARAESGHPTGIEGYPHGLSSGNKDQSDPIFSDGQKVAGEASLEVAVLAVLHAKQIRSAKRIVTGEIIQDLKKERLQELSKMQSPEEWKG